MTRFNAIEVAQLLVGTCGLIGAIAEARAQLLVLREVNGSQRRRLIASHQALLEILRLLVHATVILVALLALSLPDPPTSMGQWYLGVIFARKAGYLVVAIVACIGTWSARRTRLRLWQMPR